MQKDIIDKILPCNVNKDYILAADNMINNNKLMIEQWELNIINGINYSDTTSSRSLLRLIHGNVYLGDLCKAYKSTKEKKYLNYIQKVVGEYIDFMNSKNIDRFIVYHDETTALRMNYWLRIYIDCFDSLSDKLKNELKDEIYKHANLLYSDAFYAGNNNHGLFQNLALLNYTYIFYKEEKNAEKYVEKAKNRIKEYLDFAFTSESIHKEQTPVYHYLIGSLLKKYAENYKEIYSDLSVYFFKLYERAIDFCIHIIKPNGFLPQIGDNPEVEIQKSTYSKLYNDREYIYAITSGRLGSKPNKDNIIYQESGYCLFRDNWDKKQHAFYLLFTAAYNANYHKHTDDLSFVLYSDGDIIIDSGANGYNYEDIYTQYAYSEFAHNTLVVNNETINRTDGQFEKVFISDYSFENSKPYVIGENHRHKDVEHKRKIQYDRNNESISILDQIKSKNEETNNYKILFHFAPEIILCKRSNYIDIIRANRIIATINIKTNIDINNNIYYGDNDDKLKSFYFKQFDHPIPTYMLVVDCNAININIATHIQLINNPIDTENTNIINAKHNCVINQIKTMHILLKMQIRNILTVIVEAKGTNLQYAFYLYENNEVIKKISYQTSNIYEFKVLDNKEYYVRCFIRDRGYIYNKIIRSSLKFTLAPIPYKYINSLDGFYIKYLANQKKVFFDLNEFDENNNVLISDKIINGEYIYNVQRILLQNYKQINSTIYTIIAKEKNQYMLYADKAIHLDFKNLTIWNEQKYFNKNEFSKMYKFHSLNSINYLSKAYKSTRDKVYLNKGKEIIESWYLSNNINDWQNKKWAFYDMGTAERVINAINFYVEYISDKNNINIEFINLLLTFFKQHLELLMNENFYTKNHNHGILMDIAVLTIVEQIPYLDKGNYRSIAIKRLAEQIYNTISKQGVHLEHSPEYHLFVFEILCKIHLWLKQSGLNLYEELIQNMQEFIAWIVYPNNCLPPIGDSQTKKITINMFDENIKIIDSLQYILSHGKYGIMPKVLSKVYKKEGYAVIKNNWTEKALHIIMICAFHSTVHKHVDDLSIDIFYNRERLICDSGKYHYNKSLERTYLINPEAHNIVLVDNEAIDIVEDNIHKSKIESYSDDGIVFKIKASHTLFSGVMHNRMMEINRESKEIKLLDELISEKEHTYKQIFHLGGHADNFQIKGHIALIHFKNSKMRIEQRNINKGSIDITEGIYSEIDNNIKTNNIIETTKKGAYVIFDTVIKIFDYL